MLRPRLAFILLISMVTSSAQTPESRFTPEQKQQFDTAATAFKSQRYADALAIYKHLLKDLPGDAVISKFATEAALNSGDTNFALSTVKPLAEAAPDDWQAASLVARAYAESGDTAGRDAAMSHLLDLHRRGITPPNMQAYILERIKVGENILIIRPSLQPWGPYKVSCLGQVLNKDSKLFQRITLESNDADQGLFAQQHPQEAAQGFTKLLS